MDQVKGPPLCFGPHLRRKIHRGLCNRPIRSIVSHSLNSNHASLYYILYAICFVMQNSNKNRQLSSSSSSSKPIISECFPCRGWRAAAAGGGRDGLHAGASSAGVDVAAPFGGYSFPLCRHLFRWGKWTRCKA